MSKKLISEYLTSLTQSELDSAKDSLEINRSLPMDTSRAYEVGEIFYWTDNKTYRVTTAASIGETPDTDPAKFEAFVTASEKGAASGVAELDGSSLVPVAQLPVTDDGNANPEKPLTTTANGGVTLNHLDFDGSAPSSVEGRLYYDSSSNTLVFVNDITGSSLNVGHESWVRVYNDTGGVLNEGDVVYINGNNVPSGLPTVALAQADAAATSVVAGVVTSTIADGSEGLITELGVVNDLNTSSFSNGDFLYLSDSVAGGLTNVKPTRPSFIVPVAIVTKAAGGTNGKILVNITEDVGALFSGEVGVDDLDTDAFDSLSLLIGNVLDEESISVSSDGATITFSLEKSGGGDLRFFFSDGIYTLDCTPAQTLTLTAGTDVNPIQNYIYLDQNDKTLKANTTGWPSGVEHAHIATVLCQSAASLQTDGAYKVHLWVDHTQFISGDNIQGHISHINEWIRSQPATWVSGIATTPTITTNAGSEDNIDIAISSGTVLQAHAKNFPAFDTGTGSDIYIANETGSEFTKVTDLNTADRDVDGNSIANNKHTLLVIWGVVSEDSADCKIFCNLPSGFYSSEANAIADTLDYANYSIPASFKGTGFLIARLCLKYSSSASGTWTLVENLDLRGTYPTIFAGGNTSVSTEFVDTTFKVKDDADVSKILEFELSNVSTGTTRVLTVPDASGYIALTSNPDGTPDVSGGGGGHDPVTVSDSAEIDFTLTGQDISGDIKTASIAKTKLQSGVQDSLDLADSAIQSGDIDSLAKLNAINTGADLIDTNDSRLHDAVTVSDSPEINLTLVGQDISGDLVAGSIDESKLDASTNASLDLADSSLQPADIGSSVQAWSAILDATTASFTSGDETKLDGIESGADVTDEANVISALDGATITAATVASGDQVLIQDVDDSNNLKKVSAQSIADLGGGGGSTATETTEGIVEFATASEVDAGYDHVGDQVVRAKDLPTKVEGGGIILSSTSEPTSGGANTGNDTLIVGTGHSSNTGGQMIIAGAGHSSNSGTYGAIMGRNNTGNSSGYVSIIGYNITNNSGTGASLFGVSHTNNSGSYTIIAGNAHVSNTGQYSAIFGQSHGANDGDWCLLSGKDNDQNDGHYCYIGGLNNTYNNALADYTIIHGQNNIRNKGSHCAIFGLANSGSSAANANEGDYCLIAGRNNYNNTGDYCSISGYNNYSNTGSGSLIAGTGNNGNTGQNSTITGSSNNSNTGFYSTISGYNNYGNSGSTSIVAGSGNHSNSGYAAAIFGDNNTSNSGYGILIAGSTNTNNVAAYGLVVGQDNKSNQGDHSLVSGRYNDGNFGDYSIISGQSSNVTPTKIVTTGGTGTASNDRITKTSHGLAVDDPLRFTSLTGGTGLNTTTTYYVHTVVDVNNFTVKSSITGSQINITADYSDVQYIAKGINYGSHSSISGYTTWGNSGAYSSISGYNNERNSGLYCNISGRKNLNNSGIACSISGYYNNSNSGDYCSISGIYNNNNSGGRTSISGYANNNNSGNYCSLSGGYNYDNSGDYTFITGRSNGFNTGDYCIIGGFANASNTGDYCSLSGYYADNNALDYAQVHGGGQYARKINLVAKATTTDGTATTLTLGGAAEAAGNRINIPSDTAWGCMIHIVAMKTDGSASKYMTRRCLIQNDSGTTTISTVNTIDSDLTLGTITATVSITADNTNDALKIQGTGTGSQNTRWTARVELTQAG